jgi:hypothetical protein
MSNRDGRCLFDQLALPPVLRPYMGRPPVCVREMLATGYLSLADLKRLAPALRGVCAHSLVFPRSRVWPMGFSRSFYVAQVCMTQVCRQGGLNLRSQLADDLPGPATNDTFGLATDDIVHFTCQGYRHADHAMKRLDRAFDSVGIERHAGKDITGSLNETAIGIDLVNGLYFMGSALKVRLLLPAITEVLQRGILHPVDMAVLLGHVQWLNLLNRPLFSVLRSTYAFARGPEQYKLKHIPGKEQAELAAAVGLALFWCFGLAKPWHAEVLASDASPSFGFGLSRLTATTDFARRLGRLAEKRGDYVALLPDCTTEAQSKSRIGSPHVLHVRQSAFETLISTRCRHLGHPGLLEAHAVRMAIDWFSPSSWKHGRRLVLLVDAKSILGAVAKGRTSAGTIRRQVAKITALCLASDTTWHLLYIPSEHNPADAPSRGTSSQRRAKS